MKTSLKYFRFFPENTGIDVRVSSLFKGVIHNFVKTTLVFGIVLSVSSCASSMKVTLMDPPDGYFSTVGKDRKVTVLVEDRLDYDKNTFGGWEGIATRIKQGVTEQLNNYKFYTSVSTTEAYPVQMNFYLNEAPQSSCRQRIEERTRTVCDYKDQNGKCQQERQEKYPQVISVLTIKWGLTGVLTDVRTGASINKNYNEPWVDERDGDQCADVWTEYHHSVYFHSLAIATYLSPKVTEMEVDFSKDVDELEDAGFSEAQLESLSADLDAGVKDVEGGKLDDAIKKWEGVLNQSGGKSLSAAWNMGMVYWSRWEFKKADLYLSPVKKSGNKEFLSDHGETLDTFYKQKKIYEP